LFVCSVILFVAVACLASKAVRIGIGQDVTSMALIAASSAPN
jgi:hypothetical protein